MTLPIDTKFIEGKPCPKCGATKKYAKWKKCVECTHRRNTEKSGHTMVEKEKFIRHIDGWQV